MDILVDFIVKNYVLLIMLIGMIGLTTSDVFLDNKRLVRLRITLIMLFALALFDHLEVFLSDLPASEPVVWFRTLFSTLCYSLRPIIVMMLVFITYSRAHWLITIPATLNTIAAFSAFFTDIVYRIKPDNVFSRGPLGFTPHFVSILYIVGLFFVAFRVFAKRSFDEGFMVLFLSVAASIAAIFTVLDKPIDVNLTYGAEILLYYLYVYSQLTKRDALTRLFNRQSFYSDIEKRQSSVSGIISIDMNELKWLNDNIGHDAGDKALKTVSECFMKCAGPGDRIYRVGGDEFIAICRNDTPEELEKIVADMRKTVDDTGYSCAFGLSTGRSVDDMIKEADERMYADKEKLKAEAEATGNVLHMRD